MYELEKFLKRKSVRNALERLELNLTNLQLIELGIFLEKIDKKYINDDKIPLILKIVKYNQHSYFDVFNNCLKFKPATKEWWNAVGGEEYINYSRNRLINYAKQTFPTNIQYWLNKGFTEQEANEKVREIQSSRGKKAAKTYDHSRSPRKVQFWLSRGYTFYEAKKQVSRIQTRDLDFFIEKYGEEEGKEKFKNKTNQWQETLQAKSIEEMKEINKSKGKTFQEHVDNHGIEYALDVMMKRTSRFSSSSNEADDFFRILDSKDGVLLNTSFTHYKGSERFIITDLGIKFVDYYYEGKIIEYYGDIWHCNPLMFEAEDLSPVSKILAKDIWEYDLIRKQKIEELGYSILTVWASDVKNNIELSINQCLNFLGKSNDSKDNTSIN